MYRNEKEKWAVKVETGCPSRICHESLSVVQSCGGEAGGM